MQRAGIGGRHMAKKTILRDKKKDEAGEILPLTPTPDFDDPGRDRGFKPGRTYKSGTLYEKETGRYETPGMNGSLEKPGLRGHAKKTKPDTGSWSIISNFKYDFRNACKTGICGCFISSGQCSRFSSAR